MGLSLSFRDWECELEKKGGKECGTEKLRWLSGGRDLVVPGLTGNSYAGIH